MEARDHINQSDSNQSSTDQHGQQLTVEARSHDAEPHDNGDSDVSGNETSAPGTIRSQDEESTGPQAGTDALKSIRTTHSTPPSDVDQHEVNSKLLEAARDGHLDDMKDAIKANADLDARTEFSKETALHLACRFGQKHIVEELLKPESAFNNMNARDSEEWTPLHSACSQNFPGTMDILRILFERRDQLGDDGDRFDVNAKDWLGRTALQFACACSPVDVIKLLISKQANAGDPDNFGDTPLTEACRSPLADVLAILEVLLATGADINARNAHNSSPLTVACQYQSKGVVQFLLNNNADFNTPDHHGYTPLILSSRYGDEDMVRAILEFEPNKDHTDEDSKNALDHATLNETKNRDNIVPLLLNRGLKPSRKTALQIFVRRTPGIISKESWRESFWVSTVHRMLECNQPPDVSPSDAIKSILEFASKEDKLSAMFHAGSEDHFEILFGLMEDLQLNTEICNIIWLRNQTDEYPNNDLWQSWYLDRLKRKKRQEDLWLGPAASVAKCSPDTILQWSAYHGDHTLAWYLLKTSERDPVDLAEDIRLAMQIAKARKSAKLKQRKTDSARHEATERDKVVASEEQHEYSKRYESTVAILSNATALERIVKKLPERPAVDAVQDKETFLQEYDATIIDFYQQDGQTDLLKASASVFDLVYAGDDSSVDKVMESAKSTFAEMTRNTLREDEEKEKKEILQLRWIHLPANHMDWMEHLALRIFNAKGATDEERNSFFDMVQRGRVELPTDQSAIKFMKPVCVKEEIPQKADDPRSISSKSDTGRGDEHQGHYAASDAETAEKASGASTQVKTKVIPKTSQEAKAGFQRLALYTPYITFGYCEAPKRGKPDSKHKLLLEKYVGSILHGPRSLDRFYYNSLVDDKMNQRDRSQVVTRKLLKSIKQGMVPKETGKWPFLTVDQLWVWVIDNKTIITSSTHREDQFDDILVERIFHELRKGSSEGSGQTPPSSAIEMSHFLVSSCVDFLNNLTWQDVCHKKDKSISEDAMSKPVRLLYADSLNDVMATEKELFRKFKGRITKEKKNLEPKPKKKNGKRIPKQDDTKTPEPNGSDNRDTEFKSLENLKQDKRDWRAIHRAAKLLDEVKDIRDELVILEFLVTQQEHVWNSLVDPNSDNHDARSPRFTAKELDVMIKMTDTIQKSVNDLLKLEEDSIKIKESIMSRDLVETSAKQGLELVDLGKETKEQNNKLVLLGRNAEKQTEKLVTLADRADQQSEDNARQEKILMLFTVVTVVFTPLSFLASFYALNTSTSRHNDDGELEYEPDWMNQRIYGISAAIVGPLLIYAFFGEIKKLLVPIEKMIDRIAWPWLVDLQWIWGLIKWMGPVATHKTASTPEGGYHRSDSRRSRDIMVEEGMPAVDSRRRHYNTPA